MKNPLARNAELIHIESMRVFLSCLFSVALLAVPEMAMAAKGDTHGKELSRVESTLQKEKAKQDKLQQDKVALEKRLEDLRRDMIDITGLVQKQEKAVTDLRAEQEITKRDIAAAQGKLEDQRESLAVVITALQRMGRVPPEALLARPSAPIDMARSFGLLQHVIPAVSEQAAEIKTMVEEMDALRLVQAEREKKLLVEQKELQTKQTSLEKMVKKRETLLAANDAQQEKSRREMAGLARQAKDLRDLMARIERQKKVAPVPKVAVVTTESLQKTGRNIVRSLKDWFGRSGNLPVAGNVATGYGDTMPGGGVSRGLRINATSGAVVTTPLDGVVRFAGPFRQYKLLVIIQHDNGDHSLLGGMQELYTKTGARVKMGEPLGKLPKLEGDSTRSTSLYYERRRNGKPIDPRRA